jgi:hypothetical protein
MVAGMSLLAFARRRPALTLALAALASCLALSVGIFSLPAFGVAFFFSFLAVVIGPALILPGWGRVLGALGGLVVFVALLLVAVRVRFGSGERYPDLSTAPLVAAAQVAPLVALDYPPGNVAIAPDGRTFFNYHPFVKAERFSPATMFELVDGAPRPYPDAAFQARYQGVFGMTVDRQGRLWLIEPASIDHERTRLLAFDLRSNALVFEHWFPADEARFAQDLRVSPDGQTVYLADTGLFRFTPASLYVLDVASKAHRRVLGATPTTQPESWLIHTPRGAHKLGFGLIAFAVGLDGLELSPDGAWLYYGAMSHQHLYKVPTAALLDPKLTEAERAKQIVLLGKKPLSDGITLDPQGRVLITDIEHGGIARLDPTTQPATLVTLTRSPDVIWADGVVVAPGGDIVFTDSAIPAYVDQLGRPPAKEKLDAGRPYHLYRFRAPSAEAAPPR